MSVRSMFFCLAINSFNQLIIENLLLNMKWINYKTKYQLEFSNYEDIQRKKIFFENFQFIVDTNAKNLNYSLEMNQFGHLKKHELPTLLVQKNTIESFQNQSQTFFGDDIPTEYDNRKKGVVSYVKNQYKCGSCYAFSAVGAIESAFALRTGKLPDLSVQEIVSCSKAYGNSGCVGGFVTHAFDYCMSQGLSTSTDYPYTADTFLFYKSGVLEIPSCSSVNLNHAALAVGYNLKDLSHLVVKNSFGIHWGEYGYFRIALFKGNMC
ncbi:hypothetical protein MXB_3374, partial [Myxobolus squamalis]